MRNFLLCTIFVFLAGRSDAQFTSAEVCVDGLTCSMCAKTVEMGMRKLPFVQDVIMNLRATTAKVVFKKGEKVDIEKLAMAVDNAGYSVGHLYASFMFDSVSVSEGTCFTHDNATYDFVGTGERILNGETVLKFIGEHYLSTDELSKWSQSLRNRCEENGLKAYFVTPSWQDGRFN